MAVSAHAQTNLVQNPGFESGLISPWIGSTGLVSVSNINQHSGSYCVAVSSSSSGHGTCLQEITGLSANTTYQLDAYGELGTATAGSIGVESYGGSELSTSLTGTGYNHVILQFTTGASNKTAVIFIGNNGLSGTLYGDDFSVVKFTPPATDPNNTGGWLENLAFWDEFTLDTSVNTTKWLTHCSYWSGRAPSQFDPANVSISSYGGTNCLDLKMKNVDLLTNGNFEAGNLSGWTSVGSGSTGTTTFASGNASSQYVGASLTQGSGAAEELEQTITVLPNTQYRMCADLKVGASPTTITMGVVSPATTKTVSSTSWTYTNSILFTTGSSQTSATIYIENNGAASSVAYCDEVSVVPTTLPDGLQLLAGNYLTASVLQSATETAGYGYYEAVMQPAAAASTSSFWMQAQAAEEIDVAEECGQPSAIASALNPDNVAYFPYYMRISTHYFTGGNDYSNPCSGVETGYQGYVGEQVDQAFHTYGVDWEQNTITFYFDGNPVAIRTIEQLQPPPVPNENGETQVMDLQYLFFDTEVFKGYGIPPASSSSDFYVKYIRAWTHAP